MFIHFSSTAILKIKYMDLNTISFKTKGVIYYEAFTIFNSVK